MKKMTGTRTGIVDLLYFAVGSSLYALAMNIFILPNQIAPGGVSGIASVLHTTLGFPAGVTMFALNIPLFIIAAKVFGVRFIFKTFIAMTMVSAFIELYAWLIPYEYFKQGDTAEGLIAALFGGVLSGLGLAVIFLRGATTGGSEIGARLLRRKFPGIPFGRMILIVDIAVVVGAFIVLRNVNALLFAIIVIYLTSTVIDAVLDGNSIARVAFIVTDTTDDIKFALMDRLARGVTVLKGSGGYTDRKMNVLMCALRRQQVQECRNIVREFDRNAFVIIVHATEVLGLGFADVNKDVL